ncbi:GNAT family N-acetyltransferase [Thalassotalea agarivorans]|uniref:Predicted N-acyltransferase, GNAT family n=1 Tax=Thalassotalea agarivorans TaxID=349064 RepID=A0A1I0DBR8_THASX|nr:GNAT family N-acetyltransferase [Thalassotalea agarivorans]SET29397.1 Predicted N-acyltransferase, GNAT family [Thalassotalea agarivorans]
MSFTVCRVHWEHAAPLLKEVRERVFVVEQRIPKHVEFDVQDRNAAHLLVCEDRSQLPVATGRILPDGEIGRIAVVPEYRRAKLDFLVLKELLKIAKRMELQSVSINSPLDKVQHFNQKGFKPVGHVYMEAGLPKQKMACNVSRPRIAKYYLNH